VMLQLGTTVVVDETYGELSLRLSEIGAAALIEALALLGAGAATETPQQESLATYAPKIDRAVTRVDWSKESRIVGRVIRAYDPRPGAWTTLGGAELKLFGARAGADEAAGSAGEVLAVGSEGLTVGCGTGAVRVTHVQPSGKKRMTAEEWLRGRGVAAGQRFA
jgi:methionyl-tRNA formyltransferase